MFYPAYPVFIEKFRQNAPFNYPVFNHVGDTGGGTQVIFQNQEITLFITDNVNAADMGIDASGRDNANDLAPEILALVDQFRRNHTVLDDLLFAVEVFQKQVECAYPLFETGFDPHPFRCGDDAGDQVKGPDPLDPFFALAVDRKGDPFGLQCQLGFVILGLQCIVAGGADMIPEQAVMVTGTEVVSIKLVVGRLGPGAGGAGEWRHVQPPTLNRICRLCSAA